MIGSGRIRGSRVAPDVVAHLGIPFGEPPIGLLRFALPQLVAGWSGVRDCTRFGPIAVQSAVIDGMPRWSPGEVDVLTVNVWAPLGARGLPVLFWVHGGAAYGMPRWATTSGDTRPPRTRPPPISTSTVVSVPENGGQRVRFPPEMISLSAHGRFVITWTYTFPSGVRPL